MTGYCGKTCHGSLGKAEAQVRSLKRRELDRPEEGHLRPYWCPRCKAWHTGHFKVWKVKEGAAA